MNESKACVCVVGIICSTIAIIALSVIFTNHQFRMTHTKEYTQIKMNEPVVCRTVGENSDCTIHYENSGT